MAGTPSRTAHRVQIFQHVPFEGPARIGHWLQARGHHLETTRFYEEVEVDDLPHVDDYDWLVVMGGPMSADEDRRLPWLPAERRCIADAVSAGRVVLGICLGAQLIAAALGGRVYRNYYREIGWYPVTVLDSAGPTAPAEAAAGDAAPGASLVEPEPESLADLFSRFPAEIPALHWHGDTFSLPFGARLLARTDACVNQAFAVGDRVLGLQFHLEATRDSVAALVDGAAGELDLDGPYIADRDEILGADAPIDESNRYLDAILSYLERR